VEHRPYCGGDPEGNLGVVAAVSARNVWAVGTIIEHWDGSAWSVVHSPSQPGLSNTFGGLAAIAPNNVWAAGYTYDSSSGVSRTLIEHWNGSAWSIVPSPNPSLSENRLNTMTALSANNIWAVGHTVDNSSKLSQTQTLIEHWDGSTWSVVNSPNVKGAFNNLNGVAAVSGRDIWAVGNASFLLNTQTLIEHWNGTTWNITFSPNVPSTDNFLYGVTRVPYTDEAWSVGFYGPCCIEGKTLTLFHA
jgi:hypothetical protein